MKDSSTFAMAHSGPCEYLGDANDITLAQLESSSQLGCVFCSLFLEGIMLCIPKNELEDEKPIRGYNGVFLFGYGIGNSVPLDFFTLPEHTTAHERFLSRRIPGNTDSESSLRFVSGLIQSCIQNHSLCGTGDEQSLPSRILSIESSNDSPTVRIVESPDISARYACLSHCWGTSRALVTTRDSLSKHCTGIPWSDLPHTYRDAILYTQKLGLQYVWIDSLCIVQDDKDDWERELAQMASIYANSFITLAATKSAGCHGGLFSELSSEFKEHPVATFGHDDDVADIYVRRSLPHYEIFKNDGVTDEERREEVNQEIPLLQRAWVYQERFLSPRMLHFTNNELVWECRERTECECLAENKLGKETQSGNIDGSPKFRHARNFNHGKNSYAMWYSIVNQFSTLDITFETDKLPALAGLASQMQNIRIGRYLAGLWEDDLLRGLLWHTEVNKSADNPRPKSSTSPTWSWISVRGGVENGICDLFEKTGTDKPRARVLAAQCVLAGSNPYGEVLSGYIKISGPLLACRIQYPITYHKRFHNGTRKLLNTTLSHWNLNLLGHEISDFSADYALQDHGPLHIPSGSTLFVLKIVFETDTDNDLCLVLNCIDRRRQTYQRIGFAECRQKQWGRYLGWWKLGHRRKRTVTIV